MIPLRDMKFAGLRPLSFAVARRRRNVIVVSSARKPRMVNSCRWKNGRHHE
jgi:hypothetical protein